jgi:hypothetical protein
MCSDTVLQLNLSFSLASSPVTSKMLQQYVCPYYYCICLSVSASRGLAEGSFENDYPYSAIVTSYLCGKHFFAQNYWGFELRPPPGILKIREHNVSETGSLSVLR